MEHKYSKLFEWSSGKPVILKEGNIPVYGSNGIIGYTDTPQYSNKIILGRVGAYCGSVEYCSSNFNATDNTLITTCNEDLICYKYAYYMLKVAELNKYAGGSAQPLITQSILKHLKCDIPSLKSQDKIASILSTYDDLIEKNNRKIEILQEMAEELYKEWFVRFRFPGHEDTKFQESKYGKIPTDWNIKLLSEVANIKMGQSPNSCFYNEDGLGLPFHQGVTNFGLRFPRTKTYCSCSGRFADIGDILVSVRAPVGRINIANSQMIIGRGLAAMKSKDNCQTFLLYSLFKLFDIEDKFGNGSIFNSITSDELSSLKVLYPSNSIIRKFEDIVKPMDDTLTKLMRQNENLKQQRDLLLPRLMSGKLEVKAS